MTEKRLYSLIASRVLATKAFFFLPILVGPLYISTLPVAVCNSVRKAVFTEIDCAVYCGAIMMRSAFPAL